MFRVISICLLLGLIYACTPDEINSFTGDPKDSGIYAGGALLLSEYNSLEDLKKDVRIIYTGTFRKKVHLSHQYKEQKITGILKPGISEKDLEKARDGNFLKKLVTGIRSPYAAIHQKDLKRIVILARRRRVLFGEGDVAFYDLSAAITRNLSPLDTIRMSMADRSEKGYFNTFNHITAQAMMCSIFSERFAEFIADIHELGNMPELTHGLFSDDQLADRDNGPVDNYLDMINNEWGQELGKYLKEKYGINRHTLWTPALLAAYLNDIQSYYSASFFIGFRAFRPSDAIILRFSKKLNTVMNDPLLFKS